MRTGGPLFKAFLAIRNSILRKAIAFVAISSQIEDEYQSNGIPAGTKVHRISNSVDIDLFRPVHQQTRYKLREKPGLPIEQRLVIYTGRLVSYKGLPLLLHVWKRISKENPETALILVGGWLYGYLQRRKTT